jgi:hypothetical protein
MAVLVYGILYIVVIYMYSFILPYTGLTDMMFCLPFGTIHVLLGKASNFLVGLLLVLWTFSLA